MSLWVRARLVVARYGHILAVVLLLLAATALGAAISVWMNPPTETVTEEVDVEEYALQTHTEAVVSGPNVTLYEPGQRLVDMPVYYFEETPQLTLVTNLSVPSGQRVSVEQVVRLELTASRNERTFFQRTRVLGTATEETTDGRVTFTTEIDMLEVRGMIQEERAGLRGVGTLNTQLVLEVAYESERYAGEFEESTRLTVGEQAYWPEQDISAERTHSQRVTTEVERPPDVGRIALYGATGLLLLLGGVALGWRYLEGFDVDRLRTELARSEFSDWISTGEIPTRSDKEYVTVVSLEDLVDIGIDSNKRVIYDDSIEAYAVVDADVVYYYTHHEEDIRDWLDV